ncbi:hypothetical protein HZC35_00265 [Candidatus Saganbacteria bacterium]|nr:hypothetical protein [Candidatus Saganbacteria bacterium]
MNKVPGPLYETCLPVGTARFANAKLLLSELIEGLGLLDGDRMLYVVDCSRE